MKKIHNWTASFGTSVRHSGAVLSRAYEEVKSFVAFTHLEADGGRHPNEMKTQKISRRVAERMAPSNGSPKTRCPVTKILLLSILVPILSSFSLRLFAQPATIEEKALHEEPAVSDQEANAQVSPDQTAPAQVTANPEQEYEDLIASAPLPDLEVYEGVVTKIWDANQIDIDGVTMKLMGIRAPLRWWWEEPMQCFSQETANYFSDTLLNKTVRYQVIEHLKTKNPYVMQRIYLYFNDQFMNASLILSGFALALKKVDYDYKDAFEKLEKHARFHNRGLWHTCVLERDYRKVWHIKKEKD